MRSAPVVLPGWFLYIVLLLSACALFEFIQLVVFNYDYDIVIDNNSTEADLKEVANIFVTDVLQNKIRIRYIAKVRVLN